MNKSLIQGNRGQPRPPTLGVFNIRPNSTIIVGELVAVLDQATIQFYDVGILRQCDRAG